MTTTSQMHKELLSILEVTCKNVKYESNRTKSQLLQYIAVTLNNITTLVQNISKDIEKVEQSKRIEMNLKNEAYFFIIEKGFVDEFKEYVENIRNKESCTTQTDFIMKRFTTQL